MDQALRGGSKVTAAADDRTNTVVFAAPGETVKIIENMLTELDANPATVVTIKSFHLKVADADEVSRLITSIFTGEAAGTQVHGVGDQPLRARVSAVAELRTNTVVVTGPASVMTVIEDLIKELESNPSGEQKMKSFHLKFADATATAAALEATLDQSGGRRRRGPGVLERVSVTPDARTNTVFVTGPGDVIRDAEKIVAELDTSPAMETPVKFFHLKLADAGTAARLITGFFVPGGDAARRGAAANPAERSPINAQADDRSNTLVVHAPAEAMKIAEQIINEIEMQPWLSYDIHSYALTSADADATAKLITSIFAPDATSAQGSGKNQALKAAVIATADSRTNSVVVTAPQESLKAIDALIKLLDSNPGTGSDMKVFQLQYADAESASKLIQSMFPQAQSSLGIGPRNQAGPTNQLLLHMPLVIASADDRTNTLVVTAPADVLKVVEALVRQLDANPASKQTFFIYRLRNGKSADMASVMNQLFGGTMGSGSRTSSGQYN
ncbi:MAG TPA: secretin N-terminal domain-containing protein, partial [Tepidisphaeraceae bacterium]